MDTSFPKIIILYICHSAILFTLPLREVSRNNSFLWARVGPLSMPASLPTSLCPHLNSYRPINPRDRPREVSTILSLSSHLHPDCSCSLPGRLHFNHFIFSLECSHRSSGINLGVREVEGRGRQDRADERFQGEELGCASFRTWKHLSTTTCIIPSTSPSQLLTLELAVVMLGIDIFISLSALAA